MDVPPISKPIIPLKWGKKSLFYNKNLPVSTNPTAPPAGPDNKALEPEKMSKLHNPPSDYMKFI